MKYLPNFLRYLITVFVLVIGIASLGRLILIINHSELLPEDAQQWMWLSLWNGLRFDAYIASFVIAIPTLVLGFMFLFNAKGDKLVSFFGYFVTVFLCMITVFVISDLPYFEYYNARVSKGILTWMDSPGAMLQGLFTDMAFVVYTIIAFVLLFVVIWLNHILLRKFALGESLELKLSFRIPIFLISLFLLFIGIRGSWDFSDKPLTAEKAIISDHAFVNQAVMNPVFNFFDSFRQSELKLMPDEAAIDMAQKSLNRQGNDCSPVNAMIQPDSLPRKFNIVLILVESLTSTKVSLADGVAGLTPHIDSLARNGIYFPNFYSSGVHTHNGVFSSLYALPTTYNQKPLADNNLCNLPFRGLPVTLNEKGYHTSFYYTGDLKFDNMSSFLHEHGFDQLYGMDDYDPEDIYNAWGLSDHKLYDYILEGMDAQYEQGNPFFITALTVSTHHGYDAPAVKGFDPDYPPKSINLRYQYADWCIGQFLRKASSKPYFENTIFAIVGDHGQNFNPVYELPLSYVHVPFILYGRNIPDSLEIGAPGIQIDIFPTIMGLTGMGYENNSLGIDLLKDRRPYAYFSSDEYIACIDEEYYWLSGLNGKEGLYRFRQKSTENLLESDADRAGVMKSYTASMLQTSQYMMRNNRVGACD